MGNDTATLPAYHDEARRLQQAARHAIDAYHLQKVMIGVCTLLERMTEAPQAPASVVNPAVHHALRQIHNTLLDRGIPWDTKQALTLVVAHVLQVVRDAGESAPQADEAARAWNRL
jgi:hypothetical protein